MKVILRTSGLIALIILALSMTACGLFSGEDVGNDGNNGDIVVNLVQNPSFEEVEGHTPAVWTNWPVHWDGVRFMVSADAARTGDFGVKNVRTADEEGQIVQNKVSVVGGHQYRLSVWFKGEGSVEGGLRVSFNNDEGDSVGDATWIVHKQPASTEWEEMKGTIDVPEGATILNLQLRFFGVGTLYFDDASVSPVI